MKKSNLGALVILVGIAMIGFVWFRRNKPSTADNQLADLTAESNSIKGGAKTIDKPFIYSQQIINTQGQNPYSSSILSPAEQQQVNQNVKENVECGSGLALLSGIDCTNYNIRQQQQANPNNINTQGCNPPKLLITNVQRANAGFPTTRDSGSLWSVFFNICGANVRELAPISWKIIIIDSIGSQEMFTEKQYFIFNDKGVGGNLPRRPKSAVITLSITDNKGKKYVQTFNYKE